MKLIAMINQSKGVSLGEVMNALMHLTLGLGHRLEGLPSIDVFIGDHAKVRVFRTLAAQLSNSNQASTVFSDFPHTMVGGDTDTQLALGRATPEADMKYFASYFISDNTPAEMQQFLQTCDQFDGYRPFTASSIASLLPPRTDYSNETIGKKIVLAINPDATLATAINACIIASLSVGKAASFNELRLLNVMDADGSAHSNISYHPFPILKAKNKIGHGEMAEFAAGSQLLISHTARDNSGQSLATVAFGNRTDVESIFTREKTELYRSKFPAVALKIKAVASISGVFANRNGFSTDSVDHTLSAQLADTSIGNNSKY